MKTSKNYMWFIITAALAGFLFSLDGSIVNIALPTISRYFKVCTCEVSFVATSYLLTVTSTLLLFGKLVDRKGIKKILIYGYALFLAGSLLCGFSVNIYMLILCRALQGLGGSMLLICAFAIVPKFIPSEFTGWAFGILSTSAGIGITLGGPLGGFVIDGLSWQWIFFVPLLPGVIALVIVCKVIPGEKIENKNRPFDLPGAIFSFLAFAPLIYAINMAVHYGWTSPVILSCFMGSIIFFTLLIIWEKKHPEPLVELELLKNLNFILPLSGRFFAAILQNGNLFIMPFYLELVKKLSPAQSGLVITSYSVVLIFIAPFAGRLSDMMSPDIICSAAMAFAMILCLVFVFTLHISGFFYVILFLVLLAFSYGFFYPPNNKLIMSAPPKEKQGMASGFMTTIWTLGFSFGVSLFETVFSSTFAGSDDFLSMAEGSHEKIPLETLIPAFSNTYLLGAFLAGTGLVFFIFLLARKYKDKC